ETEHGGGDRISLLSNDIEFEVGSLRLSLGDLELGIACHDKPKIAAINAGTDDDLAGVHALTAECQRAEVPEVGDRLVADLNGLAVEQLLQRERGERRIGGWTGQQSEKGGKKEQIRTAGEHGLFLLHKGSLDTV